MISLQFPPFCFLFLQSGNCSDHRFPSAPRWSWDNLMSVSNRSGRQKALFFLPLSTQRYRKETILLQTANLSARGEGLAPFRNFPLGWHLISVITFLISACKDQSSWRKSSCSQLSAHQCSEHGAIITPWSELALPLSAWSWAMIYEAILAATVSFLCASSSWLVKTKQNWVFSSPFVLSFFSLQRSNILN